MNSQSNYLPVEVRCYIVSQAQQGIKYQDIIQNVQENFDKNIVKGTISKVYQKYKNGESLMDRPKPGRPPMLSIEEEKELIEAVEQDRKLNATAVASDPKLNPYGFSSRWISKILDRNGLVDAQLH